MIPCSSRARSRRESVRGLIPLSDRSSSQKRIESSARSRMIRSVHFPEMMSAVRQTAHSSSNTHPRIPPKLYFLKLLLGELVGDLEPDLEHLDPVGPVVDPPDHLGALALLEHEQLAALGRGQALARPLDAQHLVADNEGGLLAEAGADVDHHRGLVAGQRGEEVDLLEGALLAVDGAALDVGRVAVEANAAGAGVGAAASAAAPGGAAAGLARVGAGRSA